MPTATQFYDAHAHSLCRDYESLEPEQLTSTLHGGALPHTASRVLDIGSGSGRDAAWLAGMGHGVVAIEPSAEMLEQAKALHREAHIQWLHDSLPDLR